METGDFGKARAAPTAVDVLAPLHDARMSGRSSSAGYSLEAGRAHSRHHDERDVARDSRREPGRDSRRDAGRDAGRDAERERERERRSNSERERDARRPDRGREPERERERERGGERERERERGERERTRAREGERERERDPSYRRDHERREYERREYERREYEQERGRGREREREYERGAPRERDYRGGHEELSRGHRSQSIGRPFEREPFGEGGGGGAGKYFRDGGYGGGFRKRDRSPIALFDKYSSEALSPYRGVVLPLEDRQRMLRNWDAAPPGFERITADKAKLTGLFPPPGNIAKITNFVPPTLDPTKAAMLAMLTSASSDAPASYLPSGATLFAPALSKQARRVYVGNIPKSATEDEISDFFNFHMSAIQPPTTGQYVLGVEIAGDRDYAFVDLRSSEEADLATRLDQNVFQDQTITVRRTREFQAAASSSSLPEAPAEAPENNQLVVSGVPKFLLDAHLKYLLAPFGQLKFLRVLFNIVAGEKVSYGICVLELDDSLLVEPMRKGLDGLQIGEHQLTVRRLPECVAIEDIAKTLSLFSLTPGSATTDPSPVMQLLNMVTEGDLVSDSDFQEILDDIREECAQYGEIVSLLVPRPTLEHRTAGVGKIFVEYRKVEDCMRAVKDLSGRTFADRTVLTSYYPPEKYHKLIL